MSIPRLRASCEERLQRLDLPHHFDTGQLCDAVSALRGKPIVLEHLDTTGMTDGACGVRIELPDMDLLLYEQAASPLHQHHILAHEISHILFDHPGSLSLEPSDAAGLDLELVIRASGRTSYTTADEQEAEMLATLICQRMYRERLFPASRPTAADDRWDAIFT